MKRKSILLVIMLYVSVIIVGCSSVSPGEGVATPTGLEVVEPTENITDTPSLTVTEEPTISPTPIQETGFAIDRKSFPDSGFRNYVLDHFDTDYDERLSFDEIQAARTISVVQKGIESLEGIHYFYYLTELDCRDNSIKEIDLSENPGLRKIDCSGNKDLISLQLPSNATELTSINCSNTALKSFSPNKALKELYCSNTQIRSLVFEKGSMLETLVARSNLSMSEIEVSGCKSLKTMECSYSGKELVLNNSALVKLDVTLSSSAYKLDVTGCENLQTLIAFFYYVTSNESNERVVNAKGLKHLYLADVNFSIFLETPQKAWGDANFSKCEHLKYFDCYGAKKIDVTGCKSLTQFNYDEKKTKVTGNK